MLALCEQTMVLCEQSAQTILGTKTASCTPCVDLNVAVTVAAYLRLNNQLIPDTVTTTAWILGTVCVLSLQPGWIWVSWDKPTSVVSPNSLAYVRSSIILSRDILGPHRDSVELRLQWVHCIRFKQWICLALVMDNQGGFSCLSIVNTHHTHGHANTYAQAH